MDMTVNEIIWKCIGGEMSFPVKINYAIEKKSDRSEGKAGSTLSNIFYMKFRETGGKFFSEVDVPFTKDAITEREIVSRYNSAYGRYCDAIKEEKHYL